MKVSFLFISLSSVWLVTQCQEFHIAQPKMTFMKAVNYCAMRDLQLVDIKSEIKNNFVTAQALVKGLIPFWVNANDMQREGKFVDADNEPVTYVNWGQSEPNNDQEHHDCVAVESGDDGKWTVNSCKSIFYVLCEPIGGISIEIPEKPVVDPKPDVEPKISYHFATTRMSWDNAVTYCAGQGMKLVKIFNEETNTLVYSLAKKNNFGYYWINANDKVKQFEFVTTDNEELIYTNFYKPDQPDDANGNEKCVHVYNSEDTWNDLNCETELNVICQLE